MQGISALTTAQLLLMKIELASHVVFDQNARGFKTAILIDIRWQCAVRNWRRCLPLTFLFGVSARSSAHIVRSV